MKEGGSALGTEGKRRWVVLAAIYACILAYAISLQSAPPNLGLIIGELDLTHAQGGLLMSFFALPGIIVCIPAGILADRFSQKKIGIISLILVIAGSAMFATGANFPVLALGRAISGIGSLTLVVICPQLVVQWFTGHRLGTAMGILNTAFPIGTVLSLNLLSIISSSLGWRTSIWISTGVSLAALVMFAWLYAPAPQVRRQSSLPSEGFFHGIRQAGAPIWLVATAWMLYNAALI